MQTRTYNGPSPEVELISPVDGSRQLVAQRESIAVSDALAALLDEQGDTWLREDGVSAGREALLKRAKAIDLHGDDKDLRDELLQGPLLELERAVIRAEGSAPTGPVEEELDSLTRAELNALASETGVENPEKLPSKAAVIEALQNSATADAHDQAGEQPDGNATA